MFIVWDFFDNSMSWKLLLHDFDIDQTVRASVDENYGCLDISSGKSGYFVIFCCIRDAKWRTNLIVIHLKFLVADDLEPMDDRLGGGERIEMGECGQLLMLGYVLALPVEEEGQ